MFSVGPFGAAVLGLISLPIVVWLFSAEDIGRLSMLQMAISFSILLFSLGLDQAYVREFHEEENKPSLLKSVLLPGLAILCVVLVVLMSQPWSLSKALFGIDSVLLTSLLLIAIFVNFLARFLSLILRMQERGLAFSISQLLPKVLFLCSLLVYLWIGVDANFENLMIANLLSLLVALVIFAWNTQEQWLLAFTAKVDRVKQKKMIRFGLPLIGSGVAFWGLTAMDKIFLRELSGFEELGIYSVAVSFSAAALVFQAIFSTVWAPVVYKWAAEGVDPIKVKNVIDSATLVVMVIWALVGIFSWMVLYILPPEYAQVRTILLATMAYPLLYTLSEATGVGIGIQRKTMYSALAAILALVTNAIGNWLLIPVYGAAGAGMASAGAFFVFFMVRTEASARLWNSFERLKMYFLIVIGVLLSVVINTQYIEIMTVSLLYLTLFAITIGFYWVHVKEFL
jgi:O-antigen/teichoic acid export membrane protein